MTPPAWYDSFDASPFKAWAEQFLSKMTDGSIWQLPMNDHVYKIDKTAKTLILIRGTPDEPFWKNKKTFGLLGYAVMTQQEAGLHGQGKTSNVSDVIRRLTKVWPPPASDEDDDEISLSESR